MKTYPLKPQTKYLAIFLLACFASTSAAFTYANEWSGIWRGVMSDGNNQSEVVFKFSESGLPIVEYTNNQGLTRSIELVGRGQTIEYVPQGGGVKRHVVDSISRQDNQLSYVLYTSFERTSGGYLDQSYQTEFSEFLLNDDGMKVRVTIRSTSYFGDTSLYTGGANDHVAEGILHKI